MALKEQLHADMIAALKSKDELRLSTLRMVLTRDHQRGGRGQVGAELSDDEVLKVVAREAKKRREAAEAFDGAGRTELADRERAEGAVLESLPAGPARRRRARRPWSRRPSPPPAQPVRRRWARS